MSLITSKYIQSVNKQEPLLYHNLRADLYITEGFTEDYRGGAQFITFCQLLTINVSLHPAIIHKQMVGKKS